MAYIHSTSQCSFEHDCLFNRVRRLRLLGVPPCRNAPSSMTADAMLNAQLVKSIEHLLNYAL